MYQPIKRAIDIAGSAAGLLLAVPLLGVLAWRIRRDSPGPVLFRQARPGRDGKLFTFYKFRSMRDAFDADGEPLPDAERITPLGDFLRRTSLDELPSLWNVLKGEMSLVGPRPLLPRYLDRYTPAQARRHEVKPGVTGWAQIHGRNALSWERRLELDVWYVDHASLWLDLRILIATVVKVLRREGISADNHATMPEFWGTESGLTDGLCCRNGLSQCLGA